jgi:hypothetical protein
MAKYSVQYILKYMLLLLYLMPYIKRAVGNIQSTGLGIYMAIIMAVEISRVKCYAMIHPTEHVDKLCLEGSPGY